MTNLKFVMMASMVKPGVFRHVMCRNSMYPRSGVLRFPVADEQVFWSEPYAEYCPPSYTAPHIGGQVWADAPLPSETIQPKWNQNDGQVNRESFHGAYEVRDGLPRNPIGRTGLSGRGSLGRWGPNHAADPIVTRWKRDANGQIVANAATGKNILQMVAIQRSDNKLWAIPGGMVDPGENVTVTLKREFTEEALNFTDKANMVEKFFKEGLHIYSGYVDDFRNTDNAWMETTALNFHDEDGSQVGQLELVAGDDASNVRWTDVDGSLKLHANHSDIVRDVAIKRGAHW
ncbi:ADP-ribose pyrophosphatase, mitochondrial isoform X2 [Drosophila pseudoobscura]|uniref:ADP-ribose pyrophosphatase, mitochondrial isoform X2 n=1 Tax=Drosophila pseudoobscura pseudoobscura TaxID=46245 RepID=A0A0R3P648_DROPS|nr:ADP-ribose pyrophosphatase, mitochondrial isoform X2 [Drosophila pseudoobscura]